MPDKKNTEREMRIFKNKFKTKDSDPDFKALFTIDGKSYTASLYNRKSKNDLDYVGGKIFDSVEKEEQTNTNTNSGESILNL